MSNQPTVRRPSVAVLAASGRARAAVVAGVTAVVFALVCDLVAILRVPQGLLVACAVDSPYCGSHSARPNLVPMGYRGDQLLDVFNDSGDRAGVIVAFLLLCVPLLLLMDQAVRLGGADRERRYRALSVAGLTRAELRRLGVIEVVTPAGAGVALGFGLWQLARHTLSGPRLFGADGGLVPKVTGPGWWVVLIAVAVLVASVVVGVRAAGRAVGSSSGATTGAAPSPWRLVVLVVGLLLVAWMFLSGVLFGYVDTSWVTGVVTVLVLVAGLMSSASWVAHRLARRLALRATRAEALLAARRVMADPRATARAAAASGGTATAFGVALAMVFTTGRFGRSLDVTVGVALVALVVVVVAVAGAVAVRSVEAVTERRREAAAMVATGVPVRTLVSSLAVEVRLAALPLTLFGALLGAGYAALLPNHWYGPVLVFVVTVAVMVAALQAAIWMVAPQVRRAVVPANLRNG